MFLDWLFGGKKNKELGKVVHYFDKLGVAVVELKGALKVGDRIKIARGGHEFVDTVSSMQVDRQEIGSATGGQEVAIKICEPTKAGAMVTRA